MGSVSCNKAEDKFEVVDQRTMLSASASGVILPGQIADRINHAVVYFVERTSSVLIDRRDGVVSDDGSVVRVNAYFSAHYIGKDVDAYFISNAENLSDQLNIQPNASFDVSRFSNLKVKDSLNGPNSRYPMSSKVSFRAGDTNIPEVKFDRSFAKVFLASPQDLNEEELRNIRIVSVEIVSPSAAGYLFQDAVVEERGVSRSFIIDRTLDQLKRRMTLCYLYPDEEGAHLIVTFCNEKNGRQMRRRVIFRPQKNTAHKLVVTALPNGDTDCSISVSDWDGDILLPEMNTDGSSEINIEEGIDLNNKSDVYYYYNLLNNVEKDLYRAIFHMTNNFTNTPPIGGRLEVHLPFALQGVFDKNTFNKVMSYLWNDMPVLFNSTQAIPYRTNYDQKVLTYRIGFVADRAVYNLRVELLIKAARKFLDSLEPGTSELEIVKMIHDKFLRSVSYGGMSSALAGNVVGGLVDKRVVCEGYSETFQYLLQRCGIQSIFIGGSVISSNRPTPHAWNIVRIDGQYYFVDCTWNDGMTGSHPDALHYKYFLKSEATMSKTHTLDMNTPIPNCKSDYPLNFD